jgi:GR25 family glycosyltransferase involved in LPS biosynthesis
MKHAPIVLFVYNRPEFTIKCLEALAKANGIEQFDLYIFSDGHKNDVDKVNVDKVRGIIESRNWAKTTTVIKSIENKGLANQIINGIHNIFEENDRVIVIEDDIIVEKDALLFLNNNLNRFETESDIYQITAFQFPIKSFKKYELVYLPNISTWAWATWKSKWNTFNNEEVISFDKKLNKNKFYRYWFNLLGGYPYSNIVSKEASGDLKTWGIRFLIHVFKNNGKVVYPGTSMITNIGFTSEATNTKSDPGFFTNNDDLTKKSLSTRKFILLNTYILSRYLKSLKK